MIEILFLYFFYHHLADAAMERGRYSVWGWLGAVLWLVGEAAGLLVALALGLNLVVGYGVMLLGAATGATIAYFIVHNLAIRGPAVVPVPRPPAPPATFDPCRECGKVIATGLERCPHCMVAKPSAQLTR